jgi:CHAT domain-containing protein
MVEARLANLLAASMLLALASWAPARVAFGQAAEAPASAAPGEPTQAPALQPLGTTPPRTVSDIITLLGTITPDQSFGRRLRQRATAEPMPGLEGSDLAAFYFNRGAARANLGDIANAVSDLRQAVAISENDDESNARYLARLDEEEFRLGNYREVLQAAEKRAALKPNNFAATASLAHAKLRLGDLAGAVAAETRATDQAANFLDSNPSESARANANHTIAWLRGDVDRAQGRYAEAETQYRAALDGLAFMLTHLDTGKRSAPRANALQAQETILRDRVSSVLVLQHRYAEAEAFGRETLVATAQRFGPDSFETAAAVSVLAHVISLAGRQREAIVLMQKVLDIYSAIGLDPADGVVIGARQSLAIFETRGGEFDDAAATFAALKSDLEARGDKDEYDRVLGGNVAFATVEARAGRSDEAIAIERRCIDRLTARLGADNFHTAVCRAGLASALASGGRTKEALAEFQEAVPILIANANDDPASNDVRVIRVMVDRYLRLLDELKGGAAAPRDRDLAADSFIVANEWSSLAARTTLGEATARMSLPDPALAALARREQDIRNERRELDRILLAIASAPPGQQDEGAMANLRRTIAQLDQERASLFQQIAQRFPRYADLLSPHGVNVADARALLKADEALIAIDPLEDRTLVWAIAKEGPLGYGSVRIKRRDLAQSVALLRHALDPHATSLGAIPPFDVALAHKLYQELLAPIESVWRGKKTLIVVANGPLAQLPLTVLVTRDVAPPQQKQGEPLFSGYRDVPFLVRVAAVTELPSVAALASLRKLPPGDPRRRPFVGFGDPWFNAEEMAEAERSRPALASAQAIQVASRGGAVLLRAGPGTEGLDSAALDRLPRLPDTAEELRQVADVLGADPSRDLFLGAKASEETIETMKLDDRRVVMFATHGLVPGDINGLTQPALALSPPSIAGGRGDGLLTAGKILGLKLDADWVVLSACNTGAADGAGAAAVTGLGGAFFYAGARALLVTNWPVETVAARLLTTGTFRREAANAGLSRAEALRETEIELIDGKGAVDSAGRMVFSYAHPLFWAPFSLVGD